MFINKTVITLATLLILSNFNSTQQSFFVPITYLPGTLLGHEQLSQSTVNRILAGYFLPKYSTINYEGLVTGSTFSRKHVPVHVWASNQPEGASALTGNYGIWGFQEFLQDIFL